MKDKSSIPTVADISVLNSRGPWNTKSGGRLNVLFSTPLGEIQDRFFSYEKDELDSLPVDIRGLRIYTVSELPNGKIGGTEWHKIRREIVFCIRGSVQWLCEDVFGNKKVFILDAGKGIFMPPFILHIYAVTEEGSELLVVANTLFVPNDPRTHDTYSTELFSELQREYGKEPECAFA